MKCLQTIILMITTWFNRVSSICYFPAVYQGVYETQRVISPLQQGTAAVGSSGANNDISYSNISILYDSITVWGYCYRRVGSNVILKEDSGGLTCFRCFHLALRSSNILQIHTRGLNKCFTTEEAALATCVTQDDILEPATTGVSEVMLYRTKGFLGEPAVSPTYCPFNGAYTFTYSVTDDGNGNHLECENQESEISDCPFGFGFNLQFRGCSFGELELSFHCLGDWEGRAGERYVALMDTGATLTGDRPRYRCGIYKEDPVTGKINLALSSDSTCVSNLESPESGYENLILKPKESPSWPYLASSCMFPDWVQGDWEHIQFQGDTVLYKDHRNFKTYTGKCIPHRSGNSERYLVLTRTQCGDQVYKCFWLKQRGLNTLEVQVSLYDSSTPDHDLCRDENFLDRAWTTQGRMEITEKAPYMFTGEYTGVIPDTDGLCAKLYSDCNNPEIMFYTIFNCFNRSEVYEEREYECLGQWIEDGVIYTYTERRDMDGYECFVGATTKKGEIYLQEAGNNCERGQAPTRDGMRMSRVAECYYHEQPKHPRFNWRLPTTTPQPSTAAAGGGSTATAAMLPVLLLLFVVTIISQ